MSSPSPFTSEVSFETPAQVCVVTLTGKLDALAADELQARVDELQRAGHRRFVFDAAALEYVGSLGLRIFVGLHNTLHGDGGLCLAGLSPNVRSVFVVTRLDKLLRMYPTRADAVDAARSW